MKWKSGLSGLNPFPPLLVKESLFPPFFQSGVINKRALPSKGRANRQRYAILKIGNKNKPSLPSEGWLAVNIRQVS